jgi:hypothetical protein
MRLPIAALTKHHGACANCLTINKEIGEDELPPVRQSLQIRTCQLISSREVYRLHLGYFLRRTS